MNILVQDISVNNKESLFIILVIIDFINTFFYISFMPTLDNPVVQESRKLPSFGLAGSNPVVGVIYFTLKESL